MRTRRQLFSVLATALLAGSFAAADAGSPDLLWLLERRVRIQSPTLGAGWHDGLFNRQRSEPPCYVIMIWKPRASLDSPITAKAIVHLRDISHLQAYTAGDLALAEWAGRRPAEVVDNSRWQPIPSDIIRANEEC